MDKPIKDRIVEFRQVYGFRLFGHEPGGSSHVPCVRVFCLIRYNPVQVFFPRQIFSGSSAIQPDFILKDPDQLDQPCEPFVLFGKLFALLLGCRIF